MMKTKIVALLLVASAVFTLAGCENYGKPPTPPEQTENPPARSERGAPQGER